MRTGLGAAQRMLVQAGESRDEPQHQPSSLIAVASLTTAANLESCFTAQTDLLFPFDTPVADRGNNDQRSTRPPHVTRMAPPENNATRCNEGIPSCNDTLLPPSNNMEPRRGPYPMTYHATAFLHLGPMNEPDSDV
ncbi:uncharacterized protein UV8b_06672 [Ustilaginoidea virens]|uniref:Uncharacterized protein n=1 Tax=Ustilaginoidea virens TaxID=1159556 RepID=A0A8E5MK24_USTVR|nr:uncharacterized protein UV8b_06672 [Ustilaginoidea virens]QUC22431.1 hypothetical protein UV8b_06672 [Ustilaginoidea virens]